MSEGQIEEPAQPREPFQSEGSSQRGGPSLPGESSQAPETSSRTTISPSLVALWTKALGWLVSCGGALTIILALRLKFHHETSFLFMVGMVLFGAAYVLAGQALGDGQMWPIPLLLLFLLGFTGSIITAMVVYGLYRAYQRGSLKGLWKEEAPGDAALTYRLWVAAFGVMMLDYILRI